MVCLEEEGSFGTTNHYFDSKFREDEICPPAFIQKVLSKAQAIENYNSIPASKLQSNLERWLNEARQEVASSTCHADLLTNQKKRLFAAVRAHFDVEKKTFVDNILKKTKDILIQGRKDWIDRCLLRSDEILQAAGEDEDIKQMREDLLNRVERLEECMSLLRDVPLPSNDQVTSEPEN
mmetsp:Transcript_7721/g.21508  ORF Transcript_7721/g.21508 Transcript_7721/m.21508 type:complete len:179 (-) Transcript_7721:269-805(-)